MKQKSFKLTVQRSGFTVEDSQKVVAFGQRLNKSMKVARRDFQKKSKASAERASKLVLNA
jgi:hypothetical protein